MNMALVLHYANLCRDRFDLQGCSHAHSVDPAEKSEWVELFRRSGRSVGQFCRENQLPPATLALWLRQPTTVEAGEEADLVEVARQVVAELVSAPASMVSVQLSGGARLEIAPGTDRAWVAQLMRALALVAV
jgi:transposase-like protein